MKLVLSTIVLLSILTPFAVRAESEMKMSLRDQEYKKEHLKNLGAKKGYQGNKDWDNFLKMAIKYKDKEIVEKMLAVDPTAQNETALYIYDLYQIYKDQPEFFIQTAYEFYNKDMSCVVRIFKTNPMILSAEEVANHFNLKTSSEVFKKYVSLSQKTDLTKEDLKKNVETASKCNLIKKKK